MPEHNAATGQATKTKRMSHSREYIGFPAILNYLLLFLMSKRFREICEMEDGGKTGFLDDSSYSFLYDTCKEDMCRLSSID
jgi:hypothetical protein